MGLTQDEINKALAGTTNRQEVCSYCGHARAVCTDPGGLECRARAKQRDAILNPPMAPEDVEKAAERLIGRGADDANA